MRDIGNIKVIPSAQDVVEKSPSAKRELDRLFIEKRKDYENKNATDKRNE